MYLYNPEVKKQISLWLVIVFITLSIMIVVGGLTRLTDSGLSITEWELFSGFLPPLTEKKWIFYFDLYKKIPEFTLQNYDMTMSEFKIIFWWEWAHRFLGRLIGLLFLILLRTISEKSVSPKNKPIILFRKRSTNWSFLIHFYKFNNLCN